MTTLCRLVGLPHPQPRRPTQMIGQHILGRRDVPSHVATDLTGPFLSLRHGASTIMREYGSSGDVS